MRKKTTDAQKADIGVGMQEKAALLEEGFHVLRKLEENGQTKFQWRDEEDAQAADRAAYPDSSFCKK
jgi:hypothetical protein